MTNCGGQRKVVCIEAKCRTRQTTFQKLEACIPNADGDGNEVFTVSAG